jgi:Transposase DDE domain
VLQPRNLHRHFVLPIGNGRSGNRTLSSRGKRQLESARPSLVVVRTNVPREQLAASDVVASYKFLSRVEWAFRSIKTVDLEVRPIHHRLADRVRAHLLLCMLAYYVEWHLREALAPILFDDHERAAAATERSSIIAPDRRSAASRRKTAHKRTADALPVHSLRSLLGELATFSRNTMAVAKAPETRSCSIRR